MNWGGLAQAAYSIYLNFERRGEELYKIGLIALARRRTVHDHIHRLT